MKQARALTYRRAYSLIEMLTVISCLGVVLTVIASLIHQLIRVDRAERSRGIVASSLDRLAHDLRLDAHAATGPIEHNITKLVLPIVKDRSVEYLVRESDILRTVRVAGKTKGFDIYARPPGTSTRFESFQAGTVAMIGLKMDLLPGKLADPIYRDYRIEAEPGRNIRLGGERQR